MKQIKQLMKQKSNKVSIYKLIFSMIYNFFKVICVSYCQKYITSFCIKNINKTCYEITLCIRNRLIKFRVTIPRGPSKIIHIIDQNNKDITNEIEPYLNYKKSDIKICDLELENIEIILNNGEVKNLQKDDLIYLL